MTLNASLNNAKVKYAINKQDKQGKDWFTLHRTKFQNSRITHIQLLQNLPTLYVLMLMF